AAVALLLPALVRAQSGTSALGASGDVYRVESGSYKSLFPATAPASAANNPVLALDIVHSGKLQRVLVPGTDGPETEQSPSLAVDPITNRVYLVWQGQVNIHSVLNLISYGPDGWSETFQCDGDAFSFKSNPQLAATVDHYTVLDASGNLVPVDRTIFHLVWYDESGLGQRVLYTPLVIQDGTLLHTNVIFDLQALAGDGAAMGAAASAALPSLLQAPQVRTGADGQSVVAAFIEPTSGALTTLELRSVTGQLVSFADDARAVVIDTGRNNPTATRADVIAAARAVVIDTGRKLLQQDVADFLSARFLDTLTQEPVSEDLNTAVTKARAVVIDTGVALHHGVEDKSLATVIEINSDDDPDASTHLLDVHTPAHWQLPAQVPTSGVHVYLSS